MKAAPGWRQHLDEEVASPIYPLHPRDKLSTGHWL